MLLGNCSFGAADLCGFEFVHDQETAGDLAFSLHAFSISHRSLADSFVEESAEGAETLKADFETDISHAQLVVAK